MQTRSTRLPYRGIYTHLFPPALSCPLAVQYPVMFSATDTIAEGKVMNLTVFGCTIECTDALQQGTPLQVRLILPDQAQSLAVEEAEVRWVRGNRMGFNSTRLNAPQTFGSTALCGIE